MKARRCEHPGWKFEHGCWLPPVLCGRTEANVLQILEDDWARIDKGIPSRLFDLTGRFEAAAAKAARDKRGAK